MTSQFVGMTSSPIFWRRFVSFFKFSYWSKFPVSITTGSRDLIIFFLRDWPEIRKSEIVCRKSSEFCQILGIVRVRDTNCGTDVSNEMLLNISKCQGYSSYRFWVIKRKPTGEDKITPPPTRIRLKLVT